MSTKTFVIPGTPGFSVPQDALPLSGIGEAALQHADRIWIRVGIKANTSVAGATAQIRAAGLVTKSLVNRRRTAAGYQLALKEGAVFEVRGYSANAEWKRFCFRDGAITRI